MQSNIRPTDIWQINYLIHLKNTFHLIIWHVGMIGYYFRGRTIFSYILLDQTVVIIMKYDAPIRLLLPGRSNTIYIYIYMCIYIYIYITSFYANSKSLEGEKKTQLNPNRSHKDLLKYGTCQGCTYMKK